MDIWLSLLGMHKLRRIFEIQPQCLLFVLGFDLTERRLLARDDKDHGFPLLLVLCLPEEFPIEFRP